ncbi:MAG TPA: DUF1844 domain-containing protein [Verrucomicrobiae bacterium]|nr:DUF1844 domain-containing protein [Verrucomicrobiae bacterium]
MNSKEELSRDELLSVLFAEMVVQQTNMAMIFLGQAPHPQTGKKEQNLETARLFIDQLEMLEVKTKGNLSKEEEGLLKQSLSHLRLAFVQAVNEQNKAGAQKPAEAAPAAAPSQAAPEVEDEPRKKFTKKY